MGLTIDVLNGRIATYTTCDTCGHPILGRVAIDPPAGVRDYERYMHADGCPDDQALALDSPSDDAEKGGA